MNKTNFTFDNNTFEYKRINNQNVISINFYKYVIIIVILALSLLCFFLDYQDHTFMKNIRYFTRIKKNFNNISSYINEKTGIEIEKTKRFFSTSNKQDHLQTFNCYDLGLYYVAAKINTNVYLPEFITRGNSGIWTVLKSKDNDISAKQFCNYLTLTEKNNSVMCGKDMLEKLGTSDYTINDSPCNLILTEMYKI